MKKSGKDQEKQAYENFNAHRSTHGCRNTLCQEGKGLRTDWVHAVNRQDGLKVCTCRDCRGV